VTAVCGLEGAAASPADVAGGMEEERPDSEGEDRQESTTMLALGGPWLLRASSILSEGGHAAMVAAGRAQLHLAGCVIGGACAASTAARDIPSSEREAEEAAAALERAQFASEFASAPACSSVGGLGPVLGVSLLGRCVLSFLFSFLGAVACPASAMLN
jgi:hypothetical protein